jgi:hypothetical protein
MESFDSLLVTFPEGHPISDKFFLIQLFIESQSLDY